MKLLRITNLEGDFIRDDFEFNEETEIALDVEPSQGLYKPKWDFNTGEWIEGATGEEIKELTKPQPKEISLEERLEFIQTQNQLALAELAEIILGGML